MKNVVDNSFQTLDTISRASAVVIIINMGGCQSNNDHENNNNNTLRIDVLYCGGNTVKPYFDDLKEHLETTFGGNENDKDSIVVLVRGKQDLRFTGRFEVYMYSYNNGGKNEKVLIHSKTKNKEDGWARREDERRKIDAQIRQELQKRQTIIKTSLPES